MGQLKYEFLWVGCLCEAKVKNSPSQFEWLYYLPCVSIGAQIHKPIDSGNLWIDGNPLFSIFYKVWPEEVDW